MAEWQPIETAPKDGTEFFVFERYGRPQIAVAKWIEGDGYSLISYADEALSDICPEGPTDATHWMPFPDPPHD